MPHVSHVFSLLFKGATLYAGCENEKEKVTRGYANAATGGGRVHSFIITGKMGLA